MSTGKIIKAAAGGSVPRGMRGIVKRPLVDARAEARRILAEAEERAAAIQEEAEASAAGLREAAYVEGHEAALLELNEHLLGARELRDTALSEVERDVLKLSVKIAEKIIGRELERDDAALADIVAAALRNARLQETLVIRVNPADLPAIKSHRARLDPAGRARFLDVIPDPRVARSGCVIEGASGTVNAQLATQLSVLERALLTRVPAAAAKDSAQETMREIATPAAKNPARRRRTRRGDDEPAQDLLTPPTGE
ncbi:MAG TPA: FliH/SctL family protein [Pyrinomonadaceae bacterium]|jgi:type III secretion protein L